MRSCSDSLTTAPGQKAPWLERNPAHLAKPKTPDPDVIAVTASDDTPHNAGVRVTDKTTEGPSVRRLVPWLDVAGWVGGDPF